MYGGCWMYFDPYSNRITYEEGPSKGGASTIINNINDWHHFVIVSKKGDSIKLYLDGNLVQTNPYYNDTDNISQNIPLTFGRGFDHSLDFAFIGKLDDFRIYNRPLTDSEILSLYNE